jgi:hypothetical protein
MISGPLELFINRAVERGEISLDDVKRLQRQVLPNGIAHEDEADVLIALDRIVGESHGTWTAFLVRSVADYVVWASRPTGYVDRTRASWLVRSLAGGTGPTAAGLAIVREIVGQAEDADLSLLSFLRRWDRAPRAMTVFAGADHFG